MGLSTRPGYVLSGSAHAALLLAALLSFSQTRKFDDAQESVPVEMLSNQQFNEIMKGEKTAKDIKPAPKAEKIADLTETKPQPPVAEAKKDIPTPPPPLMRQPDPGEAETKDVPMPPQRSVDIAPPPPKPEPKPQPVKPPPAPTPPVAEKPPAEDAEPLIPKPPRRPDLQKEEPKKPEPQFKPDQLAKLLEQQKQKDEAQKPVEKPAAKPKSGDETEPPHKFNLADINRLLSKEAPQRRASTASQLQQVASLGAPNASAAKMSPSLWGQLDALLQDQYKQCWTYIGLAGQKKYVPEIEVQYAQDGTLIGQPSLANPPADPNMRSLADSAMRAVRRCNPLHIPAIYQPFYDEWKDRIVRFDPDEMS